VLALLARVAIAGATEAAENLPRLQVAAVGHAQTVRESQKGSARMRVTYHGTVYFVWDERDVRELCWLVKLHEVKAS
jgi:hypothetical protein